MASPMNIELYNQSCLNMGKVKDQSVDLTLTSPPYWNSIDYDTHTKNQKAWHRSRDYDVFGKTFDDYLKNLKKAFAETRRKTKEGGFCAIVAGTILHKTKHYPMPMLLTNAMLETGWEFHQDIVWHKCTGGIKRAGSFIQKPKSGYFYPNIMTEYILIFCKPGKVHRGKAQSLKIDDLFTKEIANNVWHIAPVPPNQIAHPCAFPEELARRIILLYSDKGDTILDPFIGSGQTAIAAKRENRSCIGYDIEPKYIELALDRLLKMPDKRPTNLIARFESLKI